MDTAIGTGGSIIFRTAVGTEVHACPLHFTRFQVAFDVHNPAQVMRSSEVLTDFRIQYGDHAAYVGKAVVSSIVNTGMGLVCEATLDGTWVDAAPRARRMAQSLQGEFREFLNNWERTYRILPEFKALVTDMQTFLADLRLWLNQVEVQIRGAIPPDQPSLERAALEELAPAVKRALNTLFEQFEAKAERIDPPAQPAHRALLQRLLHPILLTSPFAWRTFTKPLGYAGDYEMVNMLLRDPFEGDSVFAKLLNAWFVSQPPAEAHRNRVHILSRRMFEETVRVMSTGRVARLFNVGCGPARETEEFLREEVANRAHVTLLDFNEETLQHTAATLSAAARRHRRVTELHYIKRSVMHLLKGASRNHAEEGYDFIFCAGLFDYLPDRVCKQLNTVLYALLNPGGRLLVTNVDACNPIRQMLDYVLEWHLVYRQGRQLRALGPDQVPPEDTRVYADDTGVNVFLEVRKPLP